MNRTRVGVLRGGQSTEYDVSLLTGQTVLEALAESHFDVRDVLIDKSGTWHLHGRPMDPIRILDQVDVFFIALHGSYGENGELQKYLDTHGVAYTGTGALGSALSMHKASAKRALEGAPYKFAEHRIMVSDDYNDEAVHELFTTFMMPSVVKPVDGGSSVATALVRTRRELDNALRKVFMVSNTALIENYVRGREVTVTVSDSFRGEDLYAFPPVEIMYSNSDFFDYDEKYSTESGARELCPAPVERHITQELMDNARHVHRQLGLRDYSRSDFMLTKTGEIFFLEVNTLPGLTATSLVPRSIDAVGAKLPHFLEHLIDRAAAR